MEIIDFILTIPKFTSLSRRAKILLLAYYLRHYKGMVEFTGGTIISCCKKVIKPPAQIYHILNLLTKGKDPVLLKSKKGTYSLSISGLSEVQGYISSIVKVSGAKDPLLDHAIPYLHKFLSKVSSDNQRKYIAEAIACIDVNAPRATIIMVWAGVIDHLYDFIVNNKLAEFNNALHARSDHCKRINVVNKDDFDDIGDKKFIEVCRSSNIITNDIRKILDEKLGIRNSCAHPAVIEVHNAKVVNFIEDLVDNVILKYPI